MTASARSANERGSAPAAGTSALLVDAHVDAALLGDLVATQRRFDHTSEARPVLELARSATSPLSRK